MTGCSSSGAFPRILNRVAGPNGRLCKHTLECRHGFHGGLEAQRDLRRNSCPLRYDKPRARSALTVGLAEDCTWSAQGVSRLGLRVVSTTAQVASDGIVCDLVAVPVEGYVTVEVDVAIDGDTKPTQPAGLPSRDCEVASDRNVFEISIGRSTQYGTGRRRRTRRRHPRPARRFRQRPYGGSPLQGRCRLSGFQQWCAGSNTLRAR